ncbi:DUF2304 domain-containing protein [Desulfogranum mediterraneum]|uniref:DUF2304 domain-containing protein n=1 Tax=Desulfogranum mediterraneum TaxID=160661 RepID=UPI00048F6DE0|nr:DUF2304 domain-containing protein [Desulfogranum mediterraneum]
MNIQLYQIIVIAISSVMLFQGAKEFFKRESGQTLLKFSARLVVWGGMGTVAVYPNSTILFARLLGMEDNFNAVVMIGFLMVFLIIFKLLSAIEKIEQNVSELTRKEALSHVQFEVDPVGKERSLQQ